MYEFYQLRDVCVMRDERSDDHEQVLVDNLNNVSPFTIIVANKYQCCRKQMKMQTTNKSMK